MNSECINAYNVYIYLCNYEINAQSVLSVQKKKCLFHNFIILTLGIIELYFFHTHYTKI
jgi:hypothetical protein